MEILSVNPQGTLLVSGAIDDWEPVRRHRVNAIVDLDGGLDPGVPELPDQILYVYYPILDEELPDLTKLDAVGKLVADLVEGGHVVLVHCRLGLNRSNLLVATALSYLGQCGEECLEHLRRLRPGALYNEAFAAYVRGLPARPRPRASEPK